jgi:hypothetical protein
VGSSRAVCSISVCGGVGAAGAEVGVDVVEPHERRDGAPPAELWRGWAHRASRRARALGGMRRRRGRAHTAWEPRQSGPSRRAASTSERERRFPSRGAWVRGEDEGRKNASVAREKNAGPEGRITRRTVARKKNAGALGCPWHTWNGTCKQNN